MNILFVTWDGPQVTYLEGLFAPIFQGLRAHGFHVHVLQFTWADAARTSQTRLRCEELGVGYEVRRIWRRPRSLGALLTAVWGAVHVRNAIRRHAVDLVLARSVLPALACLLGLYRQPTPFVFDADGLPLDEMVDFSGLSPRSLTYRVLRDVEAQAVRSASSVMTRSAAASQTLWARAGAGTPYGKFFVVKNGRDVARYRDLGAPDRARVKDALGIAPGAPLIVYCGSLGPKYCLLQMLAVFRGIRESRADARLLVLTSSPEYFAAATTDAMRTGVLCASAAPEAVASYLSAADLGLALIEPAYSMHAASAVKVAEYLLCGVPVIANRGIGDVDAILDTECGFIMADVNDSEAAKAAGAWFLTQALPQRETVRRACVRLGQQHFSLEQAITSYSTALRAAVA